MANYNVSPIHAATEAPIRRPPRLPSRVPDTLYLEAIQLRLRGAKPKLIAELLNVPAVACRELMITKEWSATALRFRDELHHTETATLSHLIHLSLEAIAERIEKGDPHIDKSGGVYYLPVSAKDAASIAATLIERRKQIDDRIDGRPDESQNDLARLFALAQKLRDVKRETESKPVEAVVTVVDEEDE